MELVNKFCSKVIKVFFLVTVLNSCSTADIDEAQFETSEEESKRVLDDSYIVEQQKKIKEYQPDKVKLKILTSKLNKSSVKTSITRSKKEQSNKSLNTESELSYLSQSKSWKDQDLASKELWKSFSSSYLKASEKHILVATYTGIKAATISIEVKPSVRYQSKDVFHFQAKAQTADYYRWIYSLNDVVDSLVDKEHFVSWKYSLIQKEKNKEIEDIQFYDRSLLTTFASYKKIKNGKIDEAKHQNEIPFFGLDYFSSFFFFRGLPLKDKDHYLFPITTKGQTWLMSLKVLAREKVKISLGEFKAIKLELIAKYTGELAKKGPIILWVTDDMAHTLLTAVAEVKIGAIKLELSEYYQDNKLVYGSK